MIFWRPLFSGSMYATLTLIGGVFVFWQFIDVDPPYVPMSVRVMNSAYEQTSRFKRGETMMVQRTNCGKREELLRFARELKRVADDLTYVMPSGDYLVELGCRTTVNAPTIPLYVAPGRYQYIVTTTYRNNPLQKGKIALNVFEVDIE